MKRFGLIIFLAAGLLAGGFVLIRLNSPNVPSYRGPSELSTRSEQVIIPVLDLSDVSLERGVVFLNEHAARGGLSSKLYVVWKEGDPVPDGLRSFSSAEAETWARAVPAETGLLAPLPSAELALKVSHSDPPQITVNLTNVPLNEAARYVSGLADHRIHETGGRLFIYPEYRLAPVLARRDFFLLSKESADSSLGHLSISTSGGTSDVRPMLEAQGVYFAPGAYARYIPGDLKVELCLAPNDMEIAEIIFLGGCEGIPSVSSRWERIKHKATPYWYGATSYLPWSGHP